jgi:hypothetical protein
MTVTPESLIILLLLGFIVGLMVGISLTRPNIYR